jgi:hypothetical protein
MHILHWELISEHMRVEETFEGMERSRELIYGYHMVGNLHDMNIEKDNKGATN